MTDTFRKNFIRLRFDHKGINLKRFFGQIEFFQKFEPAGLIHKLNL